jgi:hypothetical protein
VNEELPVNKIGCSGGGIAESLCLNSTMYFQNGGASCEEAVKRNAKKIRATIRICFIIIC